jgi:hypothetical protein
MLSLVPNPAPNSSFVSSEMVDSSKVHLHEAYCKRNRIKCEICQKFYDKDEEEEHAELHEKV